ncbi:hypothetical protein, partial [Escherichia coli]|uniref:hypothetical protein n=1 Tax=Escherichia coli TaxID=562 RepID=UPI001CDAC056
LKLQDPGFGTRRYSDDAYDRRIWWRFHLYSIPMLLWAALVGYVLLVILPAN